MEVVFAEIAKAGLTKEFGDTEERDAWLASISLHLKHPAIRDKSIRLARPAEKYVYLFYLGYVRLTFESTPEQITVWSARRRTANASGN